ncbi:ZirU family protein [Enterobacter cloacae]|uniref:ZirU family protein n=1 Tax=Enterobacter cloacae TaxID=550 RepID=UPI002FF4C249
MIKKTLLAVAISATLFSLEASANNTRANGATSAPTAEPSVGHRPVATPDGGKDLEVSGKLITGETLTINKFFITDADGDGEGVGNKEANLAKTLSGTQPPGVKPVPGVKWELVKGGNTTELPANADKSLTIPAEAAGGKIKVTYTVHTATGKPDVAHQSTSIILTPANSGDGLEGNADGTVSAKLAGVTIKVNGTPTNELNGTTTAGTPIVGSTMEAVLDCAVDSDCADPETQYDFQWQMADFTAPGVFEDINKVDYPDATSMTYTVKGTQQNKLFQVVVTPKPTKADAPAAKAKRR